MRGKLMAAACIALLAACAPTSGTFAERLAKAGAALESGPEAEAPVARETCMVKVGETVSGVNRICVYDCVSGRAAVTIPAAELCPLSIAR